MLRLRWSAQGKDESRNLTADEIKLGRGSENEVVLPDFSVSRRHAAVRRETEGWVIHDLGSTNGIQVNRVAVRRAVLRPGDKLKVGIFELSVDEVADPVVAAMDRGATLPAGAIPAGTIGSATIIRSLKDFTADYGLDGLEGKASGEVRVDQRKALDQAYSSKIFGVLTRLGRVMISADEVDEVLAKVMEIAFDSLPVDRGFILLRDEATGQAVCELARTKEKVEYRPQSEVPVSHTMVDQVMRDRVALLTYDALADQRLAGGESIRIHQIRSAMCAPLWSGEKIIGVMQVDTPFHAGNFNEQDLDLLTALANYCAVAVERLRYAKTVEFERQVRSRLERYHSPAVIESVLKDGGNADGSVARMIKVAEATVLFADLAGFTALSERLSPEEVAEILEEYFTHAVDAIFSNGGTLDKFIGDCVMAFFGAPVHQQDHALRAVRAAVEIVRGQEKWNEERRKRGLPLLNVRVAVNSGPVVVGDVGSRKRVDYTVLGNTVNVAARIEAHVAEEGTVAIGPETMRLLGGKVRTEPLGEFQLKGLQQKIQAYRVPKDQII